ncbi:glycoside hydrolase family 97 N-terminal domain-containing protein, partial [Klebsiella pneumoniae]|uniref:glycoside hydrolase family 97 N-terminal domain-containing protein n=1 Tax=Klebsiella pneumoniae TaxID=573 RepID=UPI0027307145
HMPLAIELPDNKYLAIHEAALYDYGAMNVVPTENGLTTSVTPLNSGFITETTLPFNTPWRTIIVTDAAYKLGNSKIMLN